MGSTVPVFVKVCGLKFPPKGQLWSIKNKFFLLQGLVAYPAGCTVVLYNPRKNKQQHITNPSRKTITAVGW
jgi:hypothetical protein